MKHLIRVLLISTMAVFLFACAHKSSHYASASGSDACVGNRYLEKYGCSLDRMEESAQAGDPDAQYALGYMYYYGINTARDPSTARLWIRKAAAQGQPLAKRALAVMGGAPNSAASNGGVGSISDTGERVAHRQYVKDDVNEMNQKAPEKPISHVLPNYGKSKTSGSKPATTVAPPPGAHEPSAMNTGTTKLTSTLTTAAAKTTTQAKTESPMMASRAAITLNEQRLLAANAGDYTLQLMGGYNLAAIKSFVQQHQIAKETTYYRAEFHGKPWYMLVYGKYPTSMQAHAATRRLSTALRATHPWVKSMSVVQQEIRTRRVIS